MKSVQPSLKWMQPPQVSFNQNLNEKRMETHTQAADTTHSPSRLCFNQNLNEKRMETPSNQPSASPTHPRGYARFNQNLNEKRMETSFYTTILDLQLALCVSIKTSMKRGWKLGDRLGQRRILDNYACRFNQNLNEKRMETCQARYRP